MCVCECTILEGVFIYSADPSDATVPRPSLASVSSRGSLGSRDPPADPSPTPQHSGEGDTESVFDEEGLLFGDSKSVALTI